MMGQLLLPMRSGARTRWSPGGDYRGPDGRGSGRDIGVAGETLSRIATIHTGSTSVAGRAVLAR